MTISTSKWITGLNCLTLPCEPADAKAKSAARPVYTGSGYVCAFCGMAFSRYPPCASHMGIIANRGSCEYLTRRFT